MKYFALISLFCAISLRGLGTEPPAIQHLQMQKLFYPPGATATVEFTLRNSGDAPWEGALVITHTTGLADAAVLERRQLILPAKTERRESYKFPVGFAEFGHEVGVQLRQGEAVVAEAADVFAVAINFWDVALGTQLGGFLHNTGMYGDKSPKLIAEKLALMRRHYSNWMEFTFWAPDDWGDLTPEREEWISGQAARWSNARWIKQMIDSAHGHGMKAITYGKGIGGGPEGYELLRQKPDWFLRQASGVWGANVDLWDFEHWNDPQVRIFKQYKDFTTSWHKTTPDLAKREVLDHGIDELIESTRHFGWDGVRFDGQFSAVDDVVSTRNMRRLKERVWAAFPDYLFGFNMCSIFDRGMTIPHEEREAMAGGGLWMQEAIGDGFRYLASVGYKTWRHYAEHEWEAARKVRELGGSYHYIYRLPSDKGPVAYYKFAIGAMNGAHPCYGAHELAPGENWGRFLTRYGALFWHTRLTPLDPEALGLRVEGGGKQLLWRHWVRSIPWQADQELLALPFLCLPETETIAATTNYPAAVTGVRVTIPSRLRSRVRSVWWLAPDAAPRQLPVTGQDGRELFWFERLWGAPGRVALPPLNRLGVLAFSLDGCPAYRPVNRPRFTEPVDEQALARSLASGQRKVVVDPLRPELNSGSADPYPAVTKSYAAQVSWSMSRTVMDDPEAETGRAAGADKSFPSCVTGGYFFDILPGNYRITARVRCLPASPTGKISVTIYENMKVGKGYAKREGSGRGAPTTFDNADGKYKEVVLTENYEHHGLGFCAVFLGPSGGIDAKAGGDPKFLLDWVKAERLETYTDPQLAAKAGLPAPADITVGPADQVLWIRGLFDPLYRLEPALKAAFPQGRIEPVYQRHFTATPETLAPYGTLVLPNVPVGQFGLAGRKALQDWTRAGGHLVVLGGQLSLGQGGMKGTFLEDILPCRLLQPDDVLKLAQPLPLAAAAGAAGTTDLLYYVHQVEAKPGATVTAWCGERPLILTGPAGKGRCTVFAGTMLGAPQEQPQAFWNGPRWQEYLSTMFK